MQQNLWEGVVSCSTYSSKLDTSRLPNSDSRVEEKRTKVAIAALKEHRSIASEIGGAI